MIHGKGKTMKRIGFLLLLTGLLPGCASHYLVNDSGELRFYLKAPQAKRVELLASFNGYIPIPAKRVQGGAWRVTIPEADAFTYFYRIDDRISIPECPLREKDDFGQSNCVFQKAP
jgi:1,4-alpha-glucan branching enzyme